MRSFLLLLTFFGIGVMTFLSGYINHVPETMWITVGWYLGVLLGFVTFKGM